MGIIIGIVALLAIFGIPVYLAWEMRKQRDEARYSRDVAESISKELNERASYLEKQVRLQEELSKKLASIDGVPDSVWARRMFANFNDDSPGEDASTKETQTA